MLMSEVTLFPITSPSSLVVPLFGRYGSEIPCALPADKLILL